MKLRVTEADVFFLQPHENIFSTMCHKMKALIDSLKISSRINNYCGPLAIRDLLQVIFCILGGTVDNMANAQIRFTEIQTMLIDVKSNHLCTSNTGKFHHS